MHRKNNIHVVGRILSPHGLKGEFYVKFDQAQPDWMPKLSQLLLLEPQGGKELAVTPQEIRPHKKGFLIKTKEIQDLEQAEVLKGWGLGISEDILNTKPGEEYYLAEIKGFYFQPTTAQAPIGVIEGFSSNGAQDLLLIRANDGRLLEIPWVIDWLGGVDFSQKTVFMSLPPGLLEINL